MRIVLRPLPVLYACAGCSRGGSVAQEAAAALERRGLGELSWLGGGADLKRLANQARSRWPVIALDGCAAACARIWLAREGATPQRCYMLAAMQPDEAADRIAAELK